MGNQLFRQKSLERISSPDELHDYMRVTSPRLWMTLGAITLLLVGFIAFAATATIENTVPIQVQVSTGHAFEMKDGQPVETDQLETNCVGTLPLSYMDVVQTGMVVRLGDERGKVSAIAVSDGDNESEELGLILTMEHAVLPLPDGTYEAELVLESTTPISFLWS